jgi:hypothetical protein
LVEGSGGRLIRFAARLWGDPFEHGQSPFQAGKQQVAQSVRPDLFKSMNLEGEAPIEKGQPRSKEVHRSAGYYCEAAAVGQVNQS